jgi:hypothetical protein
LGIKVAWNWDTEIFAYFKHRATNAYVEGLNSVIRKTYRLGRGYSFDIHGLRQAFMSSCCAEWQELLRNPICAIWSSHHLHFDCAWMQAG